MLSINKLLLPLVILSTCATPISYATQTNHPNISTPDQQLKERLHHIAKTHNLIAGVVSTDNGLNERNFNRGAQFSIVHENENIVNHAYKLMYPGRENSSGTLEKGYPEYFSQKGTTYLLYHSYEVFVYARVMDDLSQPILFITLTGAWDPNDHYVQWGETAADTFIGFKPKIHFSNNK